MAFEYGGVPNYVRNEEGAYIPKGRKGAKRLQGKEELGNKQPFTPIEEIVDLNSLRPIEDRVDDEDIDVQASNELARNDFNVALKDGSLINERETSEHRDQTLYDKQVAEAHNPQSSAYWNGQPPYIAATKSVSTDFVHTIEGEGIQEGIERKENSRGARVTKEREKDSNWSRLWKRFVSRNDDKLKKRGGR